MNKFEQVHGEGGPYGRGNSTGGEGSQVNKFEQVTYHVIQEPMCQ